jgi:hypothetical protein
VLRRQRALVQRDLARLAATARMLDDAIAAHEHGTEQKETSMFEGFDPSQYEDEARERWGHTEAYRESARRTASYGEREWGLIKAEAEAIVAEFASLMAAGEPASGELARTVAAHHRAHLSKWFYDCSPAMHARLGEMYVADPRFAASYERVRPGGVVCPRRDRGGVGVVGQAVIGTWPGCDATRSIQARVAGSGCRSKPPSSATWV